MDTRNGRQYSFDIISFDIGSLIHIPESFDRQHMIKPNYKFPELLSSFKEAEYPIIIGGGAAGVEMGISVQAWRNQQGGYPPVRLLSNTLMLPNHGTRIRKKLMKIVRKRGLKAHTNQYVSDVHDKFVTTEVGDTFPCSSILWLTGPKASSVFERSGLATDEHGFLLVNHSLQSVDYPFIFGSGDCVTLIKDPSLPKNGVYAIRQAPVLQENIRAYVNEGHLKTFKVNPSFLSILSTGERTALLLYKGISISGKWPWYLKTAIDRHYMHKLKSFDLNGNTVI